jgi:hypothetical protein
MGGLGILGSGSIGNTVQSPAYQSAFKESNNPFVQAAQQTAMGNIAGAQSATQANRLNQATPYGNLQYTQTGTDQFGNPMWSANQSLSPQFQGALGNISSQLASQTNTPFNASQFAPQTSVTGGGMEGWDKATGLVMQRLEPQLERQQRSLDAQLANQGIMRGSRAYTQAQQDLGQRQNDLLNQATLAGQQVQQNLYTQNLQGAALGNQAQAQAYNQAMGGYNLPLAQLGAFRQATAPTYINPYQQAAVAGPDILGAFTSSEAAKIAQQNADAAEKSALTGGLFQLGGSALSNPTVTGAISKGLGGLYDTVKGLF